MAEDLAEGKRDGYPWPQDAGDDGGGALVEMTEEELGTPELAAAVAACAGTQQVKGRNTWESDPHNRPHLLRGTHCYKVWIQLACIPKKQGTYCNRTAL